MSSNSSHTSSYEGSPVQMGNYHHAHSGTQHHSLQNGPGNSYFQYPNVFVPIGASPSDSPMACFSPQQLSTPLAGASWVPPPVLPVGGRQSPERFPFAGGEGHSATAIRG